MLSCVKADQRRHSTLQAVFRTDTGDILCVLIIHLPAWITAVCIEPHGGHIAVKHGIPTFSLNEDTAPVSHDEKAFSSCKQTVIAVHDVSQKGHTRHLFETDSSISPPQEGHFRFSIAVFSLYVTLYLFTSNSG